ncbi:MAG TPA: phytanoyl-CoA dioxygenase family protein [Vicinamibacteria bacterium]
MIDLDLAEAVERDGFAILPDALEPDLVTSLSVAVSGFSGGRREQGVYARGAVYALRNLFDLVPETKQALRARALGNVVSAVLGPGAFCVRALFLDKTPRSNWKVPWHQDATIVVKARAEVTGFGPWTTKAGLQHVAAPPGTLSAMLTLRLHLDDCDEASGAMRVVPSSHQDGRLPQDSIEQFTRYDATAIPMRRGGLLAMKPLLIRRANASTRPGPRRVIHLDFCARRLPLPLEWRTAYPLPS